MRGLWKSWMTVWCSGVLVFGVVLALAAVPGLSGPPRLVLAVISGDRAGGALLDQPAMQFAFGLQGALTIGWALTMFGMIRLADVAGAPVWRPLTFGLTVWYVIDSAISVITDFPGNAVSNTLLMATYLIPVLATGVLRGEGRVVSV